MSLPGSAPLRRALLGLAGAIAIAAAAAPIAQADFTMQPCAGSALSGRGSTFQNTAMNTAFKGVFTRADPVGCSAPLTTVTYNATGTASGSGAGLAAMGNQDATLNPDGDRDATIRFAGTDIPPDNTQRQQMERGLVDHTTRQDVTAADNNKVHVIPVAIGAIAIVVRLPDGCDYSGATLTRNRPTMSNATLEKVFAGETTTWGAAIAGLDATCAAKTIQRWVRPDDSGSTFALKQFLQNANPARTPTWGSYKNTDWPNDAGAIKPIRPTATGGGGLRDALSAGTDQAKAGGISYLDLATARGGTGSPFVWQNATDLTFWLPIQHQNAATFDDPQQDANGFSSTTVKGANCANATPKTALPADSFGDWSGVDYTFTSALNTYGICTLTYDLAFDDNAVVYCTKSTEEAQARTLKDFLTRAVISQAGQNELFPNDYDRTPTDALLKASAAVNAIGWNKGGQGRPCSPDTGQNNNPPANNNQQNNNTVTPPPKQISNAFTIASSRVSGTSIRLSLQLPGAGAVKISWSTKPKKGKKITLAAKSVKITKSGAQAISLSLSSKAKKALKKDKKLKLTLKITYTPTGGTAKTTTKTVTVKQPKKG
jgi:periplasmic binding family protein